MEPSSSSSSSATAATSTAATSTASLSLVSRAKTALHSAAAKAERVFTDIKADLKSDRDRDGQAQREMRKSTDREMVVSDASNESEEEVPELKSMDEGGSNFQRECTFPPASVIKQLALAIETGKNCKTMNDLVRCFGDSSSVKEKSSLNLSLVKSLVLREKEDKSISGFYGDEEVHSLACSLFNPGDHFLERKNESNSSALGQTSLLKDLHGVPPESFVFQISLIIGGMNSLQKMASFWHFLVLELRKLWSKEQPIPRTPLDAGPDLNSCLLHQQFQVINCCIARKQRKKAAKELLDSVLKQASLENSDSIDSSSNLLYARSSSGNNVLRLGADHPSEKELTMLETGGPSSDRGTYQRSGRVGAEDWKAANPGCVLEDFVRWHSPPDWTADDRDDGSVDGEGSSRRGRLSRRMQKEGNLWRELWETAKALPTAEQTPLFDEDLAVESIFTALEDISPAKFFEQLFVSILSVGFAVAEAALPADSNLSKLFYECKDYISAVYQADLWNEKLDDICKVSLFSKKNPKADPSSSPSPATLDENSASSPSAVPCCRSFIIICGTTKLAIQ
ncbi:Rab3 GTPase-activating protein catalytic subunit [Ananas comosus]|uniref:Rab3 GTPase-activating protein catalytic subunit n=1 Tax=Ananas comosus TaxID=4615 RepID=A0A199UN86_ANACO|nr:Rab3 GTPase-activating protein catalytic subunit [Ananas comosus]